MLFFLYGQDTYRSRQKLHELEAKFLREVDPSGVNLVRLDGAVMSTDDLHVAITTQSMFARKRMIVIESLLEKGKDDVQEMAVRMITEKQFPDDHIVVFWEGGVSQKQKNTKTKKQTKKKSSSAKASKDGAQVSLAGILKKQKFVQEFAMLTPLDVQRWCADEIQRLHGAIHRDALQLLVALAGNDLWRLSQEIHKLVSYARGGQSEIADGETTRTITKSMVAELVHGEFESNIFALTDALATRSKKDALACLHREFDVGTPALYLLSMIVRQYRILLQVSDALHAGIPFRSLPEALGIHPFVIEKARAQVTHYTFQELKNIYHKLVAIDVRLKTTPTDPRLLFDTFIAEL